MDRLFLTVTVLAALVVPTACPVKARLVGERLATAAVPVPERTTVWGLPVALSATDTDAVRLPNAVGVNVAA